MKRKLAVIDLLVAIGMAATILGGYLIFQASYGGNWALPHPTQFKNNPPVHMIVQSMLQPAIGQTIVEENLLERQFTNEVMRGADRLFKATEVANRRSNSDMGSLIAQARQFKADHLARTQYVMGRTIVNLTRQGMKQGILSGENLTNPFNDRIVATVQAIGATMEENFGKKEQARLGQWIIAAAQKQQRFSGLLQERIGTGIVNVAKAQERFVTQREALQKQLTALVAAAARTKAQPALMTQLSLAKANLPQALGVRNTPLSFEVAEARTWPDIPFGYMIIAFGLLVAAFFVGLAFPSEQRKPEEMMDHMQTLTKEMYRKAG